MFHIDRNSFGLNEVTYVSGSKDEPVSATVTVYGKGLIDRIALVVLRLLGYIFQELRPIRFSLSYDKNDKYRFPKDMYITRGALRALMTPHIEAWRGHFEERLKKKGQIQGDDRLELNPNTVDEALEQAIVDFETSFEKASTFQVALHFLHSNLHSKFNLRKSAIELFIAEQLTKMEAPTGLIEIPLDFNTGEIVKGRGRKGIPWYMVTIKIKETDNKRVVELFLPPDSKQFWSVESKHVLMAAVNNLNKLSEDSKKFTLKEIAKKLEEKAFRRQYMNLEEIPYFDHTEKTTVVLNPSADFYDLYENANHIKLGNKEYIASGTPSFDHPWKYWEMIFENRCPVIVKLNDVTKPRNAKDNDLSYWPAAGETMEFSDEAFKLSIHNKEEVKLAPDLIKRTLEVVKDGVTHIVTHIDFLGWPDKAVPSLDAALNLLSEVNKAYEAAQLQLSEPSQPQETKPGVSEPAKTENETNPVAIPPLVEKSADIAKAAEIPVTETPAESIPKKDVEKTSEISLEVIKEVEKMIAEESPAPVLPSELIKTVEEPIKPTLSVPQKIGPIAVHCVAGKGRTGTFLGMHSANGEKQVDFSKLLYEMRLQRHPSMVETKDQYVFIKEVYEALNKT